MIRPAIQGKLTGIFPARIAFSCMLDRITESFGVKRNSRNALQ